MNSSKAERRKNLLIDHGFCCGEKCLFLHLKRKNPRILPKIKKVCLLMQNRVGSYAELKSVLFHHPMRVAGILAKNTKKPSCNLICTALLHNFLEKKIMKKKEIELLASRSVANNVAFLSKFKKTFSENKLKTLYMKISRKRDCALVKVADKLDNLFMLCFNPDKLERNRYLKEIESMVMPLALKCSPPIYMSVFLAVREQEKIGYLDKLLELKKAVRNPNEN